MSTYPPALVDAVAHTLADQAYLAWVFDCVDDSHYHAWASTRAGVPGPGRRRPRRVRRTRLRLPHHERQRPTRTGRPLNPAHLPLKGQAR